MKTRTIILLSALGAVAVGAISAVGQVPQFPQTLPANTVVGRTGIGSGPAQAIPFGVLFSNLFGGGAPPAAHSVLIGEGTSPINGALLGDAQILIGQTSADPLPKTLSGDATLIDTGAMTIANSAVTGAKIASATITGSNIASATITGGNIASTTITGSNIAATTVASSNISGPLTVAVGGTGDTGTAWTAYTASPSCGTATITTNTARQKTLGKTVFVEADFTITALGTCTNSFGFGAPFTAASAGVLAGNDSTVTGKAISCRLGGGGSAFTCLLADASTYQVNARILASGVYESN